MIKKFLLIASLIIGLYAPNTGDARADCAAELGKYISKHTKCDPNGNKGILCICLSPSKLDFFQKAYNNCKKSCIAVVTKCAGSCNDKKCVNNCRKNGYSCIGSTSFNAYCCVFPHNCSDFTSKPH